MVDKNNSKTVVTILAIALALSAVLNIVLGVNLFKQNGSTFTVSSKELLDAPSLNTAINAPATVRTGSEFKVSMMAINNGNVDLKNVLPAPLSTEGNGKVTLLTQPEPFTGKLKPGAKAYFTWNYSAETMGTLEFKGSAAAENTHTAGLVTSIQTKSNLITLFPPSVK